MNEDKKKQHEILIADDNPENLRVIGDILKKEGYKIRVAKNGKHTLESIAASEPDLLLLDVNMPEMGGFEVCRILKNDKQNKKIPIIFLSALTDDFNKLHAFDVGADDYITKPVDLAEVKARVKTYLKIRQYQEELEKLKKELEGKNQEIKRLTNK